jgi:2-iminoacetate synthase
MRLEDYPNNISEEQFKPIVTDIILAYPYIGIHLSTRESKEMRNILIDHGVSQISAGSKTDVGGYHEEHEEVIEHDQFELSDERSVMNVNKDLLESGHMPSYCTACYRKGRTGDRFMKLAKKGTIGLICEPNALMTLTEYVMDYGDQELTEKGLKYILDQAEKVRNQTVKSKLKENIYKIIKGERDLYF